MAVIAGLDIGGAHVKAARVDNGRLTAVTQVPCAMWQGFDLLGAGLSSVSEVTADADVIAITMTAELTEIFESREAGALKLIRHLDDAFAGRAQFYMGLEGFGTAKQAAAKPLAVGSANFLATAHVVARREPQSLLLDIGSTTTDIIPCARPQGLTDAERLQTGELVYTGFTRTPVPSVTTKAPLLGSWQTLARDTFASMADVRRILGDLPEGVDQHETADGRSKSQEDSLRRFARGFGRDGEMRHLKDWQAAAAYVCEAQERSITDGAMQVLSRPGLQVTSVVAAGIGWPIAPRIAHRLRLPTIRTFATLIGAPAHLHDWATHCAPAVAVALALETSGG